MLYQAHITLSGDGSAAEFGKGVAYGRSRIKQLRALGKSYATENAKFGDVTVRMKLVGQQSFIHVDVAALGGFSFLPVSNTHPNGVDENGSPPSPVRPEAIIKKISIAQGNKLKAKITENKWIRASTLDWQSDDGGKVVTFQVIPAHHGGNFGPRYFGMPYLSYVFYYDGYAVNLGFFVAGVCRRNTKKYGDCFIVASTHRETNKTDFYVVKPDQITANHFVEKIGEYIVPSIGGRPPSSCRIINYWNFSGDASRCVAIQGFASNLNFDWFNSNYGSSYCGIPRNNGSFIFHSDSIVFAEFVDDENSLSLSFSIKSDFEKGIHENQMLPTTSASGVWDENNSGPFFRILSAEESGLYWWAIAVYTKSHRIHRLVFPIGVDFSENKLVIIFREIIIEDNYDMRYGIRNYQDAVGFSKKKSSWRIYDSDGFEYSKHHWQDDMFVTGSDWSSIYGSDVCYYTEDRTMQHLIAADARSKSFIRYTATHPSVNLQSYFPYPTSPIDFAAEISFHGEIIVVAESQISLPSPRINNGSAYWYESPVGTMGVRGGAAIFSHNPYSNTDNTINETLLPFLGKIGYNLQFSNKNTFTFAAAIDKNKKVFFEDLKDQFSIGGESEFHLKHIGIF